MISFHARRVPDHFSAILESPPVAICRHFENTPLNVIEDWRSHRHMSFSIKLVGNFAPCVGRDGIIFLFASRCCDMAMSFRVSSRPGSSEYVSLQVSLPGTAVSELVVSPALGDVTCREKNVAQASPGTTRRFLRAHCTRLE